MNYNDDWLIFGNVFKDGPYKKVNSRYGQKVIAVNKEEALKAGVVRAPTSFKEELVNADYYAYPVCPAGFK